MRGLSSGSEGVGKGLPSRSDTVSHRAEERIAYFIDPEGKLCV